MYTKKDKSNVDDDNRAEKRPKQLLMYFDGYVSCPNNVPPTTEFFGVCLKTEEFVSPVELISCAYPRKGQCR